MKHKQTLAMLLSMALLFSQVGFSVLAAESLRGCNHDCTRDGCPIDRSNILCGNDVHNHVDSCYGRNCIHKHDTSCGYYKQVVYHANGGTGTVPADNRYYGLNDEYMVLGSDQLTRENALFLGWSLEAMELLPAGTDVESLNLIVPGSKGKMGEKSIDLYAVWAAKEESSVSPEEPPVSLKEPPVSSEEPPVSSEEPDPVDKQAVEAYNFWQNVKNKIHKAEKGKTIKVFVPKEITNMPASVMETLRRENVGMTIKQNGKTITIPAGKAQPKQKLKAYWTFKTLDRLY